MFYLFVNEYSKRQEVRGKRQGVRKEERGAGNENRKATSMVRHQDKKKY